MEVQLSPDKVDAAKAAVLAELEKIKTSGVSEDRLARAKSQMRIARLKEMETSQDVAATMGTDFLSTGDAHFSDHYVERIDEVTAEQVQDAALIYLDPDKLLTTILLPREAVGAGGLPKAEDLIRAGESATTEPTASASSESGADYAACFEQWADRAASADYDEPAGGDSDVCAGGRDGGRRGEQRDWEPGDAVAGPGDGDPVGGADRGFLRSDGGGFRGDLRE